MTQSTYFKWDTDLHPGVTHFPTTPSGLCIPWGQVPRLSRARCRVGAQWVHFGRKIHVSDRLHIHSKWQQRKPCKISTREKEMLSSFTVAEGSWEAGFLIDVSFQNITSLLWMNAGIHEAGQRSPLPTEERTDRMSSYLWIDGEVPRSGRKYGLRKSLSEWQGQVGSRLCDQHPKGDKENKVATSPAFRKRAC